MKETSNIAKMNIDLYKLNPSSEYVQKFINAHLKLTDCLMNLSVKTPNQLHEILGPLEGIVMRLLPENDPIKDIQNDFRLLVVINQDLGIIPNPFAHKCA